MSGMTEGVPGQGGPVSDAVAVREAELRDLQAFQKVLDRVSVLVDAMEEVDASLEGKSAAQAWGILLDEDPTVAAQTVGTILSALTRAGQPVEETEDVVSGLLMGAKLVVAARWVV